MKILILGGSGMLGSMVTDYLSKFDQFKITSTVRNRKAIDIGLTNIHNVNWVNIDVNNNDDAFERIIEGNNWIINCIGITKPLVHDDNAFEIERAIQVNSIFPNRIGKIASKYNCKILQIATDCVYSGMKGNYNENDNFDATDVYGKTKSLGEVYLPNVRHLRCSIIGPEPKDFKFLIEWFRRQPKNSTVNGFKNHLWNGVTTLQFAKICYGIINSGIELPHIQHIIPESTITKANMLIDFSKCYDREDIKVNIINAEKVIDRTLSTLNPELNRKLWLAAGYNNLPTVSEMINEVSEYNFRLESKFSEIL